MMNNFSLIFNLITTIILRKFNFKPQNFQTKLSREINNISFICLKEKRENSFT